MSLFPSVLPSSFSVASLLQAGSASLYAQGVRTIAVHPRDSLAFESTSETPLSLTRQLASLNSVSGSGIMWGQIHIVRDSHVTAGRGWPLSWSPDDFKLTVVPRSPLGILTLGDGYGIGGKA